MWNNVVEIKDTPNKGYRYLPYLWIFGLKIKDMWGIFGKLTQYPKGMEDTHAHIVRNLRG
jgi:hypothetical protein